MSAEPLDQLLARARHVDERELPPAFTATVMERATAGPRRLPAASVILWAVALAVLALGATLLLTRTATTDHTPPPLPLFEAQDFPQGEP
ncbi:MAG: hypothetical protein JNK37_17950 [Verrucomicrobiales bacterium]|nr:hypothetical protein [Verrucomicrobiales bacterium]